MIAATADRGSSPPASGLTPGRAARPATDTVGDEAISELWSAHGAALVRFALKLTLGDRQRAEDIVQETLLRAWRHPEVVGTGRTAIRPWLFTVTRHIAIDMWRARSRSEAAEEILDDRHAELPDPEEAIERAVTALDVRAALAVLSAEHRQVIVEMYFRGRSVAETADVLGIPAGTVKSRSYYGLRQLRRAIVHPAHLLTGERQLSA
jgi:RNA polymerase sigma-70 factor (ECF subfamily)